MNEVSGWINEKLQIATDESYRDPTNLQGKIQKHQVFDAEVTSNKRRMEAVTVVCSEFVTEFFYCIIVIITMKYKKSKNLLLYYVISLLLENSTCIYFGEGH